MANTPTDEYTPPQTYREILEASGGFWSQEFADFCIRWHGDAPCRWLDEHLPLADLMPGVELVDLPSDPDPEMIISVKLAKPAFRPAHAQAELAGKHEVSVVRHFSRERVNRIGFSDSNHTTIYITKSGRIVTYSDGLVCENEGLQRQWGDGIEALLRNQNWVSLGTASELGE